MTSIFMLAVALMSFVLGCFYQNHKDKEKAILFASFHTKRLFKLLVDEVEEDKRDWMKEHMKNALIKDTTRTIAERFGK
jgi:hypothetical protein